MGKKFTCKSEAQKKAIRASYARREHLQEKKLYLTTDGFFTDRPDIRKERTVAEVLRRNSDGAIAVVKIYSKEGKEEKIGKTFIPGLVLKPEDHPTLTEDSIVGREVFFGVKQQNGQYRAFYASDFQSTEDSLSITELQKILREVHNDAANHRATYENKRRNWRNHFNNKKE